MSKLALIALVLGACVADDPTDVARVFDDDVTPTNVINQVELPTWGGDNVDLEIVEVTGLEIPGGSTQEHIDISNVDAAEINPQTRQLCQLADELPDSDVCSLLCNPEGFAVRLLGDTGGSADCTEQRCELPGGVSVVTSLCVSGG